jgi:hypothetical protein
VQLCAIQAGRWTVTSIDWLAQLLAQLHEQRLSQWEHSGTKTRINVDKN